MLHLEDQSDIDDDMQDDIYFYKGSDVEGLPRGEEWLISQFLASNEVADNQN